jgi:hypothetical protein
MTVLRSKSRMTLLQNTARGVIGGAVLGAVLSAPLAFFFLDVVHNVPNFIWHVFPEVIWSRINASLVMVLASAIWTVPATAALGGIARFL